MDRREAIQELKQWRDQMKSHGVPDYGKKLTALDLAIESLMLRDKYVKALERMIEGAKEINKFLEEATTPKEMTLEEWQELDREIRGDAESATTNEGETSTISEKHQLMLPLDDAVKVVGRICDEWWTLEDGDIEYIRNELEQKCYRIDQTTDCISRQQAIAYIDRLINSGLGKAKSLEYIKKYVERMESSVAPKPVGDCISRQQAVEEIALHDCTNGEVPYFTGKGVQEILNTLPPVTPTERTGWIPVSERLPECTGDVLVTVGIHRHGFGMYDEIRVATWNTVYRVFYVHEREEVICGEIIAWQPLPEIYRPEGENK